MGTGKGAVRLLITLVVASWCACQTLEQEQEAYATLSLEGWSVHVERRVLAETPDALELLQVKLSDVRRAVPEPALARLREVPIWLSAADEACACACACYHPSATWLEENGHDPAKAGGVEITKAELFLDWSADQPSMVLHELAHGYHHRVLGYDDGRLVAALERVRASGALESVLRYDGSHQRHYALENPQEFFAEMSEAWFGTNDFWPFVRAELEDSDPRTAALIEELWMEGAGPLVERGHELGDQGQ